MKWYFASRTRHQKKLAAVAKFLESQGEVVLSDWLNGEIFSSYDDNLESVQEFSKNIVRALIDSEIFVLISDPEGTDMFIELGVCLAHEGLPEAKRIYIVGDHSKRSLMQLHPAIKHVKNLEEVFDAEGINQEGLDTPVFQDA